MVETVSSGKRPSGIPFGEYRLIRRLGAGGMAEVFLAKREGPGGFEKNLVIKRILPHLSASDRFTELFLKEARLAALIDHPNLVHVSSFGQIDGQYYLAMEYVDGSTVADFLSRVGTVSPGVACRIAVDLLGALFAIHSAKDESGRSLELVHRDVSARNVMLTRDGSVKLLDFGIAVTREDEALGGVGTRRYMAPEQRLGAAVDHRADMYGVGVLLFELMTGATPESTATRPEEIPEPLWSTVSSLLAAGPEERPSSAREVQADLEMFVASRGLEGTRAHLADLIDQVVPKRLSPRRVLSRITQMTNLTRLTRLSEVPDLVERRPALWAALAVVVLAGTGAWWMLSPSDEPAEAPPAKRVQAVQPVKISPPPSPPPVDAATPPETTAPSEAPAPKPERVVKRRPKKIRRRRTPKPGRLTIDTRPWTEVYLGRRMLGMTPVVNVRLPSGKHQLTLKNAKLGLVRKITVTIRPGRTTRIQRTL